MLCLENTHNICCGIPIDENYFNQVKNILKKYNLKLHIDGARIFNAAVALKTTVKKLAKNANSISCCLSKGLAAPAGSLIMGSEKFIYKARRLRKALGGGMRQSGILAAAGIYSFDNMIGRLEEDHSNAKLLAQALSQIEEIKIEVTKVYTNIIFFYLKETSITDEEFVSELVKNNIKIDSKGNRKFRIVTHYGFETNDVTTVIDTMKLILKNHV